MAWPRKFTDEQEIDICNDYISGMSMLGVSKKWNCSDNGLSKLLRRNGVEIRPQGADTSRRSIQPEQESEVIRLHVDERLSAEKIAKLYGCSAPSIRSVLRRNGIDDPIPQSREPHISERAIKPEQEGGVVDLYKNGMSTTKIAEMFFCSVPSVLEVLKRNDIARTNKFSFRKYFLREDMFDVIDTEEKAYWLGFIYAEGCVNKEMTTLSIGLSALDATHLEKFRDTISPERPVYRTTRVSEWKEEKKLAYKATLSIWSVKLSASLHNVGISKERQAPEKLFLAIPDDLFHHWLRGYFDGDGSAATHTFRIAFVGEYKLLKWMEYKLNEFVFIGTDRTIYYPKNKRRVVGSIYFSGRKLAKSVGKFMYQDATIFLERKKEIVDSW